MWFPPRVGIVTEGDRQGRASFRQPSFRLFRNSDARRSQSPPSAASIFLFASSKLLPQTVTDSSSQLPFQPSCSSWKTQSFGIPAVTFSFIAWAVIPVLHSETLCASYRERHVSSTAYVLALSGKMRSKLDFVGSQVRPIPGAERFNLECRRERASTCACGLSFLSLESRARIALCPRSLSILFTITMTAQNRTTTATTADTVPYHPGKHWDTLISSERR